MLVIPFIFFLDAFFSEGVVNYEEIYYELNPYIFHWPLRYLFTYSKSRNRWFKSLLYKHRSSSTRLSDCVFNKKKHVNENHISNTDQKTAKIIMLTSLNESEIILNAYSMKLITSSVP